MRHINYCRTCKAYTMQDNCPKCMETVQNQRPAKFSPEDKYASYRREAKKEDLKKRGLL